MRFHGHLKHAPGGQVKIKRVRRKGVESCAAANTRTRGTFSPMPLLRGVVIMAGMPNLGPVRRVAQGAGSEDAHAG
jgi:hypothetical protein